MSGKRILLVDDEPDIRAMLGEILRGKGYEIDSAGTACDAKDRLASQTYDLVIADWKLPDGDGRVIADWAIELGAKTCVMSGLLSFMPGGPRLGPRTLIKPIDMLEFNRVG